jgi:hypothetical protein
VHTPYQHGPPSSERNLGGIVQGELYTQDLLERGICEEAAWSAIAPHALAAFKAELSALLAAFPLTRKPNECVTEKDLIYPVPAALGWRDVLVQQQVPTCRRDDIPDALLSADAGHKTAAHREREPFHVYRHGLAIVEAKRRLRPLHRADAQPAGGAQPAARQGLVLDRLPPRRCAPSVNRRAMCIFTWRRSAPALRDRSDGARCRLASGVPLLPIVEGN